MALGGLAIASGCAPQNRTSFEPPTAENAAKALPATVNPTITRVTLHEIKVGTALGFLVEHERVAVITVSSSDPTVTDIKTVKKRPTTTHVSIKIIADGSTGVQVLSDDREYFFFLISTS